MILGYTVSEAGDSITCHRCGMTSHNPYDVAALYCGHCHEFHGDFGIVELANRLSVAAGVYQRAEKQNWAAYQRRLWRIRWSMRANVAALLTLALSFFLHGLWGLAAAVAGLGLSIAGWRLLSKNPQPRKEGRQD